MPPLAPMPPPHTLTAALTAVVIRARPDESVAAFGQRAVAALTSAALQPVLAFWFGRAEALRELGHDGICPTVRVEGRPCHDGPLVGVQFYALPSDAKVKRLRHGQQVLGAEFDDGAARHLLLAGLEPLDRQAVPATQAVSVFAQTERLLEATGFAFADVARTWFFNRRILDWYDGFNRVRTALYRNVKFRSGASPASTGIEGSPASGAALALAVWAVQPHGRQGIPATPVASPLQCPAPNYGSVFSRAMEVAVADTRRLFVSGTASIAPDGRSVWPGDIDRQIALSLEVIEAILRSRGATLRDVDRAFAYFKNAADLARFEAWLQDQGLSALPFLPMHCDVCRDDLLFELELDATTPRSGK